MTNLQDTGASWRMIGPVLGAGAGQEAAAAGPDGLD